MRDAAASAAPRGRGRRYLAAALEANYHPAQVRFHVEHGSCAEASNLTEAARTLSAACSAICLLLLAAPAGAQEKTDANELAKQLSNPVAALISVPFQLNYDDGYGAQNNGARWTLNIQPVVPISISDSWNMISRTIVPLIDQNFAAPGGKETGFGDITQSLFFSPKTPTAGGWIIGAGPALLVPAGAEGFTAHQWGAGPTVVLLKQQNGWTYGALVNHIWSFAGDRRSEDVNLQEVNATFLQPFVAKLVAPGRTLTLNTESTYDWHASQWTVPINLSVSQVMKLGTQLVSVAGGVRAYVVSPTNGPDWGLRLTVTLLYPK
jgi:hypothetical protein